MPHELIFAVRYAYDSLQSGITIPVILDAGATKNGCYAKVDTGAEFCLFRREVGEDLQIDIESGERKTFGALTGSFVGYGHEVTLSTFGIDFYVTVYFAELYGLPRNLLGRNGWLQKVRLGLADYDAELFLSAYHEYLP